MSRNTTSAFELRFLELIKGGEFEKRAIRVKAAYFDSKFGLWRCEIELVGVLKLPARAIGFEDDGTSTPESAQRAALSLAKTVLSNAVLVNRDGTQFIVPEAPPATRARPRSPRRSPSPRR